MFKIKYYLTKAIARFKVRLVTQGFSLVEDIDYKKTFVVIIEKESFGIFLVISVALGLIIHLVDIINAYLKTFLDDNKFLIYINLLLRIYELC